MRHRCDNAGHVLLCQVLEAGVTANMIQYGVYALKNKGARKVLQLFQACCRVPLCG